MDPRGLVTSVRYAWRGLVYAFRTERHMRVHVGVGLAALLGAASLRVSATEWLLICVSIALVLSAELLNTGVEVLVDSFSRQRRARAMVIKDLSAGAVLLSSLSAAVVGCVVFLPRLAAVLDVLSGR